MRKDGADYQIMRSVRTARFIDPSLIRKDGGGLPDYEFRADGKIYRAVTHPDGWSGLPDYEIRSDGKIYRAVAHPNGWGGLADYEFR